MKKTLMLGILVSFIFISFFSVSATAYEFTYYRSNTATPATWNLPPFHADQTCNLTLGSRLNFTDTSDPREINFQYLSPGANVIGGGLASFTSNQNCTFLGDSFTSTTAASGALQAGISTTDLFDSRVVFGEATYSCDTPSDIINFDFSDDGNGIVPNVYYMAIGGVGGGAPVITDVIGKMSTSTHQICAESKGTNGVAYTNAPYIQTATAGGLGLIFASNWILPFNSSNGNFSFIGNFSNFTGTGTLIEARFLYYPLSSPGSAVTICSGTGLFCQGNITVAKNTDYVFEMVVITTQPAAATLDVQNPYRYFEINTYEPDFLCGEYSDCINGTQSRTCVDQNGIDPDLIEFQSCFDAVAEATQVIGFEQGEDFTFLECKKDPFLCTASPQEITVTVPVNWTSVVPTVNSSSVITPSARLAYLTSEDSSHGFNSLLMVYNPPQLDFVGENPSGTHLPAVCTNGTVGYIPQVYGDINNATNIIFTDIVFPTPYITIAWDVALKADPVVKYDTNNPFCIPEELCYSRNCSISPLGDYLVRLAPTGDIFNTIFQYNGEATEGFDSVQVDLSNANLTAGTSYRLIFALNPDDQYEPDGYTVLFDNVRVSNYNNPVGDPTGGCVDFCNGTDLFIATSFNNTCTFEIDLNNSVCIAEQQAEAIAESTDPISGLAQIGINASTIEESGFGFTLFFLSPFFLFFAIILLIGGYAEYKINSGGTVFGLIMLLGTVFVTFVFPEFIGFSIVLIIIAGFITVHTLMKGMKGG